MGEFDHPTNACKNEAKCVNCHKNHQSKSNQCEIWKKEKEIMKIKVTQKITHLEAKKIQENQPEITFAKVVQSPNTKPPKKVLPSLTKKILSSKQIQKLLLLL